MPRASRRDTPRPGNHGELSRRSRRQGVFWGLPRRQEHLACTGTNGARERWESRWEVLMFSLANAEGVSGGHSREGDSVCRPVTILGRMAAENGYGLARGDGLASAGWFRNFDCYGAIRGVGHKCSSHITAADGALRRAYFHCHACLHLVTGLRRAGEVGWDSSSCLCEKPGGNLMCWVCALPRGGILTREHWAGYTVVVATLPRSVGMFLVAVEG